MVTIKRNTLKITGALIVLALALYIGYSYWLSSSYPDIVTPKPTFGDPNAKVKVIEFADIQCPACKAAHPIIEAIKKEYGNNISYQYYHFPLLAAHPYAQKAAEAVECANDQGMFWEYLNAAFDKSPKLPIKTLRQIARDLEMETEKFNACLGSGKKFKIVRGDLLAGQARKVQGTPSFFINGKPFARWDEVSLRAAIDRELRS